MTVERIVLTGTRTEKAKLFHRLITTGECFSSEKDVIYYRRTKNEET